MKYRNPMEGIYQPAAYLSQSVVAAFNTVLITFYFGAIFGLSNHKMAMTMPTLGPACEILLQHGIA